MKKIIISVFFTLIISSSSFALDSFDIYQTLEKSTLRLSIWENWEAYDSDDEYVAFAGSGVIINKVGKKYFILTNAHVVLKEYCLFEEITNCQDEGWDDTMTIVIDNELSEYEYSIGNEDIIYWENLDLAVVILDMSLWDTEDVFSPIKIGGIWHPLMKVYGAGYPAVLGNYKNYRDIFYCSGEINSVIFDEEGLNDLLNYSMVHSCGISGGMSGGPLVDSNGMLLGINGLIGDAELSQNQSGEIESADFDNLKYAYAIRIYDLYEALIYTDSGYFDPNSEFYQFIPQLSFKLHRDFYIYLEDLYPDKIKKISKLFN